MLPLKRLLRVLGDRVFWSFVVVTFLMAGLLATVNLASRYALKEYIDGQLRRTPWDLSVYQSGSNDPIGDTITPRNMRHIRGIKRVDPLPILRAKLRKRTLPLTMESEIPPWRFGAFQAGIPSYALESSGSQLDKGLGPFQYGPKTNLASNWLERQNEPCNE